MSRPHLFAVLVLAAACGGQASPPTTTPPNPPPGQGDAPAGRAPLTAAQCEAEGGKVVGDIGDGATQRPEYRCPGSGEPPIGNVVAEAGQPVAIEGAVCCR
jgi:hypothetical protein